MVKLCNSDTMANKSSTYGIRKIYGEKIPRRTTKIIKFLKKNKNKNKMKITK